MSVSDCTSGSLGARYRNVPEIPNITARIMLSVKYVEYFKKLVMLVLIRPYNRYLEAIFKSVPKELINKNFFIFLFLC